MEINVINYFAWVDEDNEGVANVNER